MVKIQFVQKGFKLESSTKEYIKTKILKHKELLDKAISISVNIRFNQNYSPDKKYRMEVSLSMPHTFIRVEERGISPESLIDELEVLLKRKVKRYLSQFSKWEKEEPWKFAEVKEFSETVTDSQLDYLDYEPEIKRVKLENNTPIQVGEAIERLEMSGKNAILFRNYSTNNYAMLYKDDLGTYELVEADV